MNRFVKSVADVLETPSLTLDTEFRAVDGWCSLTAFGLLVALENDWRTPLTIDRLRALRTVRDLYREAFLSFAARLLGVPRERLSGETAYGELAEWDSVNHLRMVMEAEQAFGTEYPIETVPGLRRLEDWLVE